MPPSVIDPSEGSSKRAISCANVDLPDPEGPISAVSVPGSRVRLTPFSACVSPYEYVTSLTTTLWSSLGF